ncbi:MAG TPA: class I SAM-dependent methyltransferase [Gaiellales bacterium]|jgi:SAM-dependent methyltransferase|nr:class I SAM-dependent methyltransferase [Gaiellales bacterium]
MTDSAAYDRIGVTYSSTRRPDLRIREAIWSAIGDASTVINVGAGTGSYEPPETVLAVEPSQVMIDQRPPGAAPAVHAGAELLPVPDGYADAAMALLTVHHWNDVAAGIAELRRVARRIVILTWDQRVTERFWLSREYLPQLSTYDEQAVTIDTLLDMLGPAEVRPLPIPHDCTDGFLGAFWRRPHCYLDPRVRAGISTMTALEPTLGPGLDRLRADLESGAWGRRHPDLLQLDELDLGYRLLITVS